MRLRGFATVAVGALILTRALHAQEVRRAIPVEPPTAPAVPFDFDKPTPTPAPVATPKPAAAATPAAPAEPAATPDLTTQESPDKAQIDYANSFYAKKIYDMAAPEYEKYVTLYPTGPDLETAYFRLAESYRAMGSLNAAKTNYDMLLTSFTGGEFVGPASYRLADLYYQEKNYDVALPLFRRASVHLTDKAVVVSAKFFTARCLENLNSTTEAKEIYEQVAETKDNNPFRGPSRLALARILTDEGKKVEAHKQYELLSSETDKPEIKMEALVKASLLKIDLGQYDKAETDLQKALKQPEIGPWKEVAITGLLNAYYDSSDYKQTLATYEAHSKDFSTDSLPGALLLAGNASSKLGDYKQAQGFYEQVIKGYPDSTYSKEALYKRLVSMYYANDPSLVTEVDKFLSQNPASDKKDEATLLKAEALYRKQDFAAAAPVYESIITSALPDNMKADAQFKLGWCDMQTKHFTEAIGAFSSFLVDNANHKLVPSALAQRAVAYQQTQDFTSALNDFNTLIAKYPKAKERELALQQKALILGQQQDNDGMSDTFKQLLKDYPQTPVAAQANYWIGWAAFEKKDYKGALLPLDTARKADKDQFYEKGTLRIMLSYLNLEDRDKLAAEVDAYPKTGTKIKIPAEILRWLGGRFLDDKNYTKAENYLTMLTDRKDEATGDDWLNLGRSLSSQQRYDVASKAFSVYLETAKEPIPRATGLLALCDALLGLGNYDGAQKAADDACALQPEGKLNAEGRILSGEIQMARGDYDKAARLFLSVSVILDDPNITPHAMELAIDALKKEGKDAEAAKTLNDLQTRYAEYLERKKTPQ